MSVSTRPTVHHCCLPGFATDNDTGSILYRSLTAAVLAVVLMTEGCNSPLSGGSSGQTSNDENRSNSAFIGAAVALFIIIIASVTTVILLARRRRLKRERSVAHSGEIYGLLSVFISHCWG